MTVDCGAAAHEPLAAASDGGLDVIVPNDRSREGRIVFAPAADLAWRCGAKVVNVSNTDVNNRSAQAVVKPIGCACVMAQPS